jgi:plastocyanin
MIGRIGKSARGKGRGVTLAVAGLVACGLVSLRPVHAEEGTIVKGTVQLPPESRLEDVVVYVEGAIGKPAPAKALIDQKNLSFVPRVVAVPVGSSVEFRNSDPVLHNAFSTSPAKHFDLGMFPKGQARSVTFDKPGVVDVLCNVHPKMEAFIVVLENQYFARPDEHGNFEIANIPPGRYKLRAWHPDLRPSEIWVNLEQAKLRDVELHLQR